MRPALAALAVACAACTPASSPVGPPVALAQNDAGDWQTRLPAFARYEAGETVVRWPTPGGGFAVHFSRQGHNQVPATDADADGTPDLVQAVGATLEAALAVYKDRLGLRAPLASIDGSRATLDVFLVDFAGRGDGNFHQEGCRPGPPRACSGLLLIENDFAGYRYGSAELAARVVASHELFHAVQAAYDHPDDVVLSEATATWATETFDPTLNDLERAAPGYLKAPDQPLGISPVGPVPPFAYGAAVFFQYLSERFGERTIAAMYEGMERPATSGPGTEVNPGPWLPALATALERQTATPFATAFAEFARWNATTGVTTTAASAPGYKGGAAYGRVTASALTPPVSQALRLFSASALYFTLPPGSMQAALAGVAPGAPLELAAFAEVDGSLTALAHAPRTLELAVPPGATGVRLVVSNGAASGSAQRPTLCLGTTTEIAACVAATPMSGPADAGAGDAGAGDEGGGCQLTPGSTRGPGFGAIALLGVLLVPLLIATARRRPAPGRPPAAAPRG